MNSVYVYIYSYCTILVDKTNSTSVRPDYLFCKAINITIKFDCECNVKINI